MSKKADTVVLRFARDLNDLWDRLDFGHEGLDGRTEYVPTGVYRRFAAGLSTFRNRGFSENQLRLDRGPARLHFGSCGGQFSSRKVRVDTTATFEQQTAMLVCTSTTFTVHSRGDKRYRTAFTDDRRHHTTGTSAYGVLDNLVTERFNEMLAVIGARHAVATSTLTEEEAWEQHDIHPYPRKAWHDNGARLVLVDDYAQRSFYGRGWLQSEGDTSALEAKFRRLGWSLLNAK